jgi:GAF domain-containing protein
MRTREAAERFEALGIRSLINASYIRDGQWKFVLSAQHAHPYAWHMDEAELLRELAERIYLRIERARAEEALRRHQVEIETLNARLQRAMQETHHRVKNNLQVIAALVEMQGHGGSPLGEPGIRRINTHIRALATIHDLLPSRPKAMPI